jgi:hypothetical protein
MRMQNHLSQRRLSLLTDLTTIEMSCPKGLPMFLLSSHVIHLDPSPILATLNLPLASTTGETSTSEKGLGPPHLPDVLTLGIYSTTMMKKCTLQWKTGSGTMRKMVMVSLGNALLSLLTSRSRTVQQISPGI